jgi:plasmid stabilization system protein ParE
LRTQPIGGRSIARPTKRWYAGFSDAIRSLTENPERCPLAPENGRFPYEIRELHYGLGSRPTHRAVFTIRPDMVLVLTIRHAAQAELTEEDLP